MDIKNEEIFTNVKYAIYNPKTLKLISIDCKNILMNIPVNLR